MQTLSNIRRTWKARLARHPADAPPLRADLLSVDQLARHAVTVATDHGEVAKVRSNRLLARLDENEAALRAFVRDTRTLEPGRRVTPATEWLLDNFYLIDEQIQTARKHLPRGFSRELPCLTRGPSTGLPRVFDIVVEILSHVDAQIDGDELTAFVAAYQTVTPLQLGELWAIPIMLRLSLIENLRRISHRLSTARADRNLAAVWVDRLQETAEDHPGDLLLKVAEMAGSDTPHSSAFVAEFCQRLSSHSPGLHLARAWLDHRLHGHGLSIERLVDMESQSQAADQVSVSHSIASLRFLGSTDWRKFIESASKVEEVLRTDPAGCYALMDFATRDRYRHAVEGIARRSMLTETAVAAAAIGMAASAADGDGQTGRAAHVGYYLIDKGLPALESGVGAKCPRWQRVRRGILRHPLAFYAGGISLMTLVFTLGFLAWAGKPGPVGWPLVLLTILFALCASQLAVGLMNWLATLTIPPSLLPRLDFRSGIPPEHRTMVVVPTMLASKDSIARLVESLEIHYLGNRDPHLHFALLTDFKDAAHETMPGDLGLLEWVRDGIAGLNRKYPSDANDRFSLFHRPRHWNPAENTWMGYERKRGKLAEFNSLLRGGPSDRFSDIIANPDILPLIKYVITLDTDTQLPRDAAKRLIGTMAHPLNRPEFDAEHRIVASGYGILQPRVGVSLPASKRSLFVRLFAGDAGIDPYTRAVSDVYQDIFGEGSFIGKGIYDVDAFQLAMKGRFPENAILSHDLLESCHARSALVSDVEFYEEHPSRYNVDIDRRHRWMRGDWQISQWLLPRVPGSDPRRIANPLSGLSRWKIFDNLRRSLVPAALMGFLAGSWLLGGRPGAAASIIVLGIITLPGILAVLLGGCRKRGELPWMMHMRVCAGNGGRQLAQALVTITFLPYDAFVSLDAIGRTLLRLFITHRGLLQWRTSGESEQADDADLRHFFEMMWVAPASAVGIGLMLAQIHSPQWPVAAPMLAVWLAAPWIAWWISQPIMDRAVELDSARKVFIRICARKTWHFFDTWVTPADNWLPPDNFQEAPSPVLATRTSPTNMGLSLLANLAAFDFGYLSQGRLIERTQSALTTMRGLPRYRGHFYNWYDTRTLQPLPPHYISSVDSGNLAGHLLTLAAGLREQADEEFSAKRPFAGVLDTVRVIEQIAGLDPILARMHARLANLPDDLASAHEALVDLGALAAAWADTPAGAYADAKPWAASLQAVCADHLADLRFIAPWLVATPVPDQGLPAGVRTGPLTLRVITTPDGDLAKNGLSPATSTPPGWLEGATIRAASRLLTLENLADECEAMAAMDFGFLYEPSRELFSIGFNVTEQRADPGCYDLLASEARLCSYVAIALGQVPQDHWFTLGRLLVARHGEPVLVSWSGSMFEYLMPLLVMPVYDHTLLDRTCRAAVAQQIDYGKLRGVPWGISESGYNRIDSQMNYQYRAFGVPGVGLKRGLADDLVIAPYASAMALMVDPVAACDNLRRLTNDGRSGAYGFYEAVDYTPSRMPPARSSVSIRSFMAHHQGMSLLGMVNTLCDQSMQRRFMACPMLRAADLLLQERVPVAPAGVLDDELAMEPLRTSQTGDECVMRVFKQPTTQTPEVHLLSNGRYHVAVTTAGGGYSRWHDLALTRWHEDATCDNWGFFIYLRDPATGEFFSTAFQPALRATDAYEAVFTQARAEFRLHQAGLTVHTEICVSPEDDVEVRRITLTNRSAVDRLIELTSYAEVVLSPPAADAAHPAFGNLFVTTEFLPEASAILCTRRARTAGEALPWLLHLMVVRGEDVAPVSCETDRARFIGRGRSLADPAAMVGRGPLSNTVGAVLDPVVALRRGVMLPPNGTVTVEVILGAADCRRAALALVEKYQSPRMADRAFDLAWTHSQVTLHHLNATEAEAQLYDSLATPLLYADPSRRAPGSILRANRRSRNGLWGYGISGDVPIVLLQLSGGDNLDLVRQLVGAHGYWRMKGLTVDLVILHDESSIYRQSLHEQLARLMASGSGDPMLDTPGGIYARRLDQIPEEDRILIHAAARLIVDDKRGGLAEQLAHRPYPGPRVPALVPSGTRTLYPTPSPPPRDLQFANGYGGFSREGHEYVITLGQGEMTPAPWVNVIANATFGTLVSETGASYTWMENAHEFRLTPWNNDPVRDPTGEAIYIRDERSGRFWSPSPGPARGCTPYVIRHGFGYTVFEHTENGIASELWVYVAMDAPVKISVLKLRNLSGTPRRLSVTGYVEWVMGDTREKNQLHIRTEAAPRTGVLLAANGSNPDFRGRVAFLDAGDSPRTITGDRKEFIGRNGSLSKPAAMLRAGLSGKTGSGIDPCGAVQVAFDLLPGASHETVLRLGAGHDMAAALALIDRFRRTGACREALEGVSAQWRGTLSAVQVDTPDPALNLLVNGWLLYQTIAGRLWGRTGFYQSGGAYGFRDQLQDVMALVHAAPAMTREHLLRAAGRQFQEGDVQHWWHPPTGRGVRTHSSDDYLWLPYATCRYVACVADTGVLEETVPYLEARPLRQDEEACYDLPAVAAEPGSLYQHCVRAIERGLRLGEHGLPLIGGGDWNDGMNRIGKDGRGESVWLGFFLYDVLTRFAALARSHGDPAFAERCLAAAGELRGNLEHHGWDGEWYRRAFFDNGDILGSHTNLECQIDALPQSWAVISGAAGPARALRAMQAADRWLVRPEDGLIRLFTPPFDQSALDPGYVRGYAPGVRENGGQYTHSAVWTIMAMAQMGHTERAWQLFSLINPIRHGESAEAIATYQVEPYVVAADVYAIAPHTGRGGWTWYTGAAAWMYRLLAESLLGIHREGSRLRLEPRLPDAWDSFTIRYRFHRTVYHIAVSRKTADSPGSGCLILDGEMLPENLLPLCDDLRDHSVSLTVAPAGAGTAPPTPDSAGRPAPSGQL